MNTQKKIKLTADVANKYYPNINASRYDVSCTSQMVTVVTVITVN